MANERVTSTFRLEYGCLPKCVFCDKKTEFQFLMEQYWTNNRRWHSGYIIKFDTAKRSRRIKRIRYRFTVVFLFLETADRFSLGRCDNIIVINLYNWNCLPFFKTFKLNCFWALSRCHNWLQFDFILSCSSDKWGFPFTKVMHVLKIRIIISLHFKRNHFFSWKKQGFKI